MPNSRALATAVEVADFLRKPERTLQQWRYLGIGPKYVKVGRDVRYRWEDVEKWLDDQARAAA